MKQLICLIFIFHFIEISAQTDKNFILRTSLGYNYSHKDNLDADPNGNQSYIGGINISKLNVGLNVSKKFKSNFYYGFGISYNNSKQETNPDVKFPEISGSTGFISMSSYMNTISKTSSISPFIFVQYYKSLFEKLCISFDLYSKYSFISNFTEGTSYTPDIQNRQYIESGFVTRQEYDQQFLAIGIYPSLRFNIFKNAGMELGFGNVEYSHKANDSRTGLIENKTKEFEIGFKPENWLIGFYINL